MITSLTQLTRADGITIYNIFNQWFHLPPPPDQSPELSALGVGTVPFQTYLAQVAPQYAGVAQYFHPSVGGYGANADGTIVPYTSTGGGFFSDLVSGVVNIAGAVALPAAVLALPALAGQQTLYGAIADSVSGATAVAPAVNATAPVIAPSSGAAIDSASAQAAAAEDAFSGMSVPGAGIGVDATGTSLSSIAQDALKSLGTSPTGAAKYAAGLLATMGAGGAKPAPRVAVASQGGIGNTWVIGAAALLLLAVTKRK